MAAIPDQTSAVLVTTARRWLDLTASVPVDALERPAAAGEWSAVDCLRHLLQAERHVFPRRVQEFLRDDEMLQPVDAAAIPPATERTGRELAEAFARARDENLAMFASLGPEDLERTKTSRRLGRITLRDLLLQWALHDLEHVVQAERALLQGILVQSGPLRAAYASLDQEANRAEAPAQ